MLLFCEELVGVRVTMPAASKKESGPLAVERGMLLPVKLSATFTVAAELAGTVTLAVEKVTEWATPVSPLSATLKLAGLPLVLVSVSGRLLLKLVAETSLNPKLRLPVKRPLSAMTCVNVALAGWTRPEPPSRTRKPVILDGSAVLASAVAQRSSRVHPGCACLTSAAAPATWGLDMEVPDMTEAPVAVPIPAEAMLTPGAVRSGFSQSSPLRA